MVCVFCWSPSKAVISLTPQKKGQHSFPIAGGLLKGVPCSARPNLPCHDAFVYCFRWAPISPHSLSQKGSGKEFPGQGAKLYRARAGKISQGRRSTQNLSLLAPGPAGSRLQVAGRLQGSSPRGSSKKPLPRKSSKKPSSRKASLRQGVVEEAAARRVGFSVVNTNLYNNQYNEYLKRIK